MRKLQHLSLSCFCFGAFIINLSLVDEWKILLHFPDPLFFIIFAVVTGLSFAGGCIQLGLAAFTEEETTAQ